jgi:hypothetical protein
MGNCVPKKLTKINDGSFIHEEEIEKEKEKKNVRVKYNEKISNFVCDIDETLSTVFEKFKKKSRVEEQNLYFMHNGITLNPEMKINQMKFNCDIYAYEGNYLVGGINPLNFAGISKENTEEHYICYKGPLYRNISQGINIYGICKGRKCEVYEKEVIVPLKNITKFDLVNKKYDLECPVCGGVIIPKTLGFHLCEYNIKGKKFINDKAESFETNGKADNNDSILYFNPDKNGETIIIELQIEVKYL